MTVDSTDPRFSPFVSKPDYFNKNRRMAASVKARTAEIIHHDETRANGVAIMTNQVPLAILTRDQAAQIAADIIDILTHHNQKENTND